MNRASRPTRDIVGHFGEEFFRAITCTGIESYIQNQQDKLHKNAQNHKKTSKK